MIITPRFSFQSSRPGRVTLLLCSLCSFLFAQPDGITAPKPDPSLQPPMAGPQGNVFKTLNQVEPRVEVNAVNTPGDNASVYEISQPGSYYLTGNVQGAPGKNGITISSSGVKLDLNGYSVFAEGGDTNTGIRIVDAGRVVVENGFIFGWGGDGISSINDSHVTVKHVSSIGNDGDGFSVKGEVDSCYASLNGEENVTPDTGAGIVCVGIIRNSVSEKNVGNGFRIISGLIESSKARNNSNRGISANSAQVIRCHTVDNIGSGIQTSGTCLVEKCFSANNSIGQGVAGPISAGIDILGSDGVHHTIVRNNHVQGNQVGIRAEADCCTVVGNTVMRNSPDLNAVDANFGIGTGNLVGNIIKINSSSPAINFSTGGGISGANALSNFTD